MSSPIERPMSRRVCSRLEKVRQSPRRRRRLFLAPLIVSELAIGELGSQVCETSRELLNSEMRKPTTYPKRPWYIFGDLGNDIPSSRSCRGIQH